MPTSTPQATRSSARGDSPARPGIAMVWLPSTLSTTTLSGQGFASSSTPMRRTWRTAIVNASRYGRRRRRTLATTRSVLPKPVPSGRPRRRLGAATVHRAQPQPRRHDVVGVVQDASQPDRLRDDHAQVDQAERRADAGDLRDLEDEPEPAENREEAEREPRHARKAQLGADVEQWLGATVFLGGDGDARLRPDAAEDLQVPPIPAGIDRDQILARDQELHHAAEQRLLLVTLLAPVAQDEGALAQVHVGRLPWPVGRHLLLQDREAAQPPEVALEPAH